MTKISAEAARRLVPMLESARAIVDRAFAEVLEACEVEISPVPVGQRAASQGDTGPLGEIKSRLDAQYHAAMKELANAMSARGVLFGFPNIEEFGDIVRNAAIHLRSFIGSDEPGPCFLCGETEHCECASQDTQLTPREKDSSHDQ